MNANGFTHEDQRKSHEVQTFEFFMHFPWYRIWRVLFKALREIDRNI